MAAAGAFAAVLVVLVVSYVKARAFKLNGNLFWGYALVGVLVAVRTAA